MQALARFGMFGDVVGILLRALKLIDIEMVDQLFWDRIKMVWEKTKPLAEGRRKDISPTFRQYGEYLYNELKKNRTTTGL